jgi:hypothetical protein
MFNTEPYMHIKKITFLRNYKLNWTHIVYEIHTHIYVNAALYPGYVSWYFNQLMVVK